MPDFFSAAANIIGGALGGLIGGGQRKKARTSLAGMQYPIEQIPDEVLQNQNQANQMAGQGLPSEQYNKSMRDIQRQQLMMLRRGQDRRGGLMVLPGVLAAGNDATLNLNAADADRRIGNQRYAQTVNNQVAGWKSDLFDKNVRQKYDRDYNYNMSLLGAGNENLFGGLDRGIAGLGELGAGLFGGTRRRRTGGLTTNQYPAASGGRTYGSPPGNSTYIP